MREREYSLLPSSLLFRRWKVSVRAAESSSLLSLARPTTREEEELEEEAEEEESGGGGLAAVCMCACVLCNACAPTISLSSRRPSFSLLFTLFLHTHTLTHIQISRAKKTAATEGRTDAVVFAQGEKRTNVRTSNFPPLSEKRFEWWIPRAAVSSDVVLLRRRIGRSEIIESRREGEGRRWCSRRRRRR